MAAELVYTYYSIVTIVTLMMVPFTNAHSNYTLHDVAMLHNVHQYHSNEFNKNIDVGEYL